MSMRYTGGVVSATAPTTSTTSASGVWTEKQQLKARGAGTWPLAPWQVSRSLRFNSADSAYLNRTPASAGNRKTWTWSGWVKRSALGAFQYLFDANNTSTNEAPIRFYDDDTFDVSAFEGSSLYSVRTTQVFRDVSAWYHFVVAFDTTQATASNRIKVYVNGSQITAFGTANYPTQNTDYAINNNIAHAIGRWQGSPSRYLNGYLTEINFIDGQALTPSSFGWNDPATGVWAPIQYTGTYGNNGFYLTFADNSNTTATTLGKDYSGNGNNWTPNLFSVTAGAGNDSLVDTPTSYGTDTGAGGEVRGNYCTLNPLKLGSGCTLTNGNLTIAGTAAVSTQATTGVSTGKWYFEITLTTMASNNDMSVGVATTAVALGGVFAANAAGYGIYSYGGNTYIKKGNNNTYTDTNATIGVTGDVIGVAFDMDAGKVWWAKNNTWIDSGNPATGANAMFTGLSGTLAPFATPGGASTGSVSLDINFGQRPFAYTAPSGFKALCTQNLPTPTIGATSTTQAGKYFNTVLWTGTGATKSITGVGFQPDLVWIKSRSNATSNGLFDAVRGTNKALYSNLTDKEDTYTNTLNSFDSNGFSLGTDATWGGVNSSAYTYVGWNWKASGAGASNTAGSITSTVSASTASGFSIATYTGTGSNATVGHGLGVAPSMVIVKCRNTAGENWQVYHISLTSAAYRMRLNSSAAEDSQTTMWNSTAPTSTVFSIGTASGVNANTQTYVAYCFAPVAGYSAFGKYTGVGGSDGPFVYLGFRPRYVMIKVSSAIDSWVIWDTERNTYNVTNARIYADLSDAETVSGQLDIVSNGFKVRSSNSQINTSTATYIYAAFAESPFKYSLAR